MQSILLHQTHCLRWVILEQLKRLVKFYHCLWQTSEPAKKEVFSLFLKFEISAATQTTMYYYDVQLLHNVQMDMYTAIACWNRQNTQLCKIHSSVYISQVWSYCTALVDSPIFNNWLIVCCIYFAFRTVELVLVRMQKSLILKQPSRNTWNTGDSRYMYSGYSFPFCMASSHPAVCWTLQWTVKFAIHSKLMLGM